MVNPQTSTSAKPLSLRRTINICMGCMGIYFGVQIIAALYPSLMIGFMNARLGYYYYYSPVLDTLNQLLVNLVTLFATVASGGMAAWFGIKMMGVNLKAQFEQTHFDRSWIFKGAAMMFAANLILSWLVSLLNSLLGVFGTGIDQVGLSNAGGVAGFLLNFLMAVVAAPFFEEVIFRGIMCKSLARFNKGFAVIFSALLFGIAHMNLYQAIPAFGMGIILAFVYLRSGSLWVPILMHAINNFMALLETYAPVLFSILISLVMIVLAVVGVYYIYKERRQFAGVFRQNRNAKGEWKAVRSNGGFWVLIVIFALICLFGLIGTIFLNVALY